MHIFGPSPASESLFAVVIMSGWFLLLLALLSGFNRLLSPLFNRLGKEAPVAGGNLRDLSLLGS